MSKAPASCAGYNLLEMKERRVERCRALLRYYLEVVKRAITLTLDGWLPELVVLVILTVGILVALPIYGWWRGSDEAAAEVGPTLLALAGGGVGAVIIFLINLLRAPAQLQYEADAREGQLRNVLDERTRPHDPVSFVQELLTDLAARGEWIRVHKEEHNSWEQEARRLLVDVGGNALLKGLDERLTDKRHNLEYESRWITFINEHISYLKETASTIDEADIDPLFKQRHTPGLPRGT